MSLPASTPTPTPQPTKVRSPKNPTATESREAMHKVLSKHVETKFVIDDIPEVTLIAMYLNPG
jgi:hypothetical protein